MRGEGEEEVVPLWRAGCGGFELECSMSCHSGKETSLHFSKHVQGKVASIRLFLGRGPAGSGGGRDGALSSSQAEQ